MAKKKANRVELEQLVSEIASACRYTVWLHYKSGDTASFTALAYTNGDTSTVEINYSNDDCWTKKGKRCFRLFVDENLDVSYTPIKNICDVEYFRIAMKVYDKAFGHRTKISILDDTGDMEPL